MNDEKFSQIVKSAELKIEIKKGPPYRGKDYIETVLDELRTSKITVSEKEIRKLQNTSMALDATANKYAQLKQKLT